jgi:hypothetical protein
LRRITLPGRRIRRTRSTFSWGHEYGDAANSWRGGTGTRVPT